MIDIEELKRLKPLNPNKIILFGGYIESDQLLLSNYYIILQESNRGESL